MLKVSGQYVSPFEVEAALMRHDAVQEAAVVGKIGDDGLTRTLAFVVLKSGQGRCATGAGAAGVRQGPARAVQVSARDPVPPELPKTATGKIQRFKLREGAAR
jgi:benzoate-CoA ligase